MNAKVKLLNTDVKVWCASCCIRIAPHEERAILKGQTYHTHCYSKLQFTNSNRKSPGPRRSPSLGN